MNRIDVACPRCGAVMDLPITIQPTVTFTAANGRKGFVTAHVGVGGIEHTCED